MAKKRTFGMILREARLGRGFTQQELAGRVGIRASYVAYLEADQRRPSIELLRKLVKLLQVDGRELLFLAYPDAKSLLMGGGQQHR
jgi:transcriptional regulator with XRE-family HTH domain